MFDIVSVDSRKSDAPEQLGTKSKFWFKDDRGQRMLFKAEERGTGEDWAEKVACEICSLLGLPHVHYELAHDRPRNIPGVICANCAPRPGVLVLGNQLLLEIDAAYPAGESRKYKVREHTVAAVSECLGQLQRPSAEWTEGLPDGIESALDVFVGYVLLDALIANQDRHHENWAAIRRPDGDFLAPTYDHGASLARNLSDAERYDRLHSADEGRRIPRFAARARSAFYGEVEAERPLTTLDAAVAFASLVPDAARRWCDVLRTIKSEQFEDVLNNVPNERMTGICREFTLALILENQRRLLEAIDNV